MDSTVGTALSGLFGTLIALAIVLGLAWVLLKGFKRWQDRGGMTPGEPDHQLRFVRALAVGQRERVMLIEARGELMLIGIGQASVSLLHNWGPVAAPDITEHPLAETPV